MRFEAIEIAEWINYNFIVGSRLKPDEALKERIRGQIETAMRALGREPDSYSVSILHNTEPEEVRDKLYPELEVGKNYLLFAMLQSGDSGESPLSNKELEEQQEELARGVFCPQMSRIALVLLYDSSIGIVKTKKSMSGFLRVL